MKEIPLTQGQVALVDDSDYEYLSQWKWFAQKHRRTYYATRNIRVGSRQKPIHMHKEILGLGMGVLELNPDHIDGNGVNNQRYNLRLATNTENLQNTEKYRNCSNKFKGVSWHKRIKKWHAYIRVDKKLLHIGYFQDEEVAAHAYDRAARQHFGEFAKPNFPIDKAL